MRLSGRLFLALTVLSIFGMSSSTALAAPGDLDTSFGAGGKTRVDFGGNDYGLALALQPDGRIVVAGDNADAIGIPNDFAVARILAQGVLDPSFAAGGKFLGDFGGVDYGDAVALQPDGRIVVAGSSDATDPNNDIAVARLFPQGGFDSSFGSGGKSLAPYASNSRDDGDAVALQDGKIVVAGSSNTGATGANPRDFAVVRLLNPSGAFDSSFGADHGGQLIDFGGYDYASAMALAPDGRIVLAGHAGAGDFGIARLLPGGAPDNSFSGDGKATVDFGGSNDSAAAVALQPDGKIVVAGTTNAGGFLVARLLPSGGLDDSFAGDGKSLVDFGAGGDSAIALQPDGKILLAGNAGPSGASDLGIARLQPNGLLDSTFGNGGKSLVDFGGDDQESAMALQPDGKIVLAGLTMSGGNSDFAVARLQGDPGGAAKNAKCAGKKATIIGSNGKDKLKGTKKRDVIAGLGGKDTIKGKGGNDLICGGKGKDKRLGGPGNDKLLGQQGKDLLKGGPGKKDKLIGGAGKDSATQ
jgi:uncharacterized delta-60 repeat protein